MTNRSVLLRRSALITALAVVSGVRMAGIAATARKGARADRLAAELRRLVERLGGAFIKVGQLAGTRVDLVGPEVAAALGRLHDSVAPMAADEAVRTVRRAFPRPPEPIVAAVRRPPVASGSIASVYRAELAGRPVALKVRRPGIGRAIAADMAILGALAAVAGRLPGLRRVPLAEIVDQLRRGLVAQLDFAAEAANLRRMGEHLAAAPGVRVPAVIPEWCAGGVIAMEFAEGLAHGSIRRLPARAREEEVTDLVRAVYRLLFVAGFVHVDLHQGNAYFRPDGTVVLLDAGFAFQLSPMAHRRFTEFFGGMIQGDGDGCAGILLSTVRSVLPGADVARFRQRVAELVVRNAGAAARDFNLPAFCVELFNLQRRYGLYAEPEFIFPMLCLLSLDGLVKEHHPRMDFQLEAAPYVMQSLLAEMGNVR